MINRSSEPSRYSGLAAIIGRFVPGLLALFALSVFVSLARIVTAIYVMQINDRVLLSKNMASLFFISAIVLWIILLSVILDWIRREALQRMAVAMDASIAPLVFAGLGSAKSEQGQAKATLVADANNMRDAVCGPIIPALFDTLRSPVLLVALFVIHPLVGLGSTLLWVALGALSAFNQWIVVGAVREAQREQRSEAELVNIVVRNGDALRSMGMIPGVG